MKLTNILMVTCVTLVAIGTCLQCRPLPPPLPPEPDVVIVGDDAPDDATPDPDEVTSSPCSRACRTMRALGCPEGQGSPEAGVSCFHVCTTAQARLDVEGIAGARTRTDLHQRGVRCVP